MTVYDLESLHQAPQLVVLAACEVGRPTVPAGDGLLGLGAALIARGTRQIVASVTPIPDAHATHLMIAFHRSLATGDGAAAALAQAQQRPAAEDNAAIAAAAGFVCIGADATPASPAADCRRQRPDSAAAGADTGHAGHASARADVTIRDRG